MYVSLRVCQTPIDANLQNSANKGKSITLCLLSYLHTGAVYSYSSRLRYTDTHGRPAGERDGAVMSIGQEKTHKQTLCLLSHPQSALLRGVTRPAVN